MFLPFVLCFSSIQCHHSFVFLSVVQNTTPPPKVERNALPRSPTAYPECGSSKFRRVWAPIQSFPGFTCLIQACMHSNLPPSIHPSFAPSLACPSLLGFPNRFVCPKQKAGGKYHGFPGTEQFEGMTLREVMCCNKPKSGTFKSGAAWLGWVLGKKFKWKQNIERHVLLYLELEHLADAGATYHNGETRRNFHVELPSGAKDAYNVWLKEQTERHALFMHLFSTCMCLIAILCLRDTGHGTLQAWHLPKHTL